MGDADDTVRLRPAAAPLAARPAVGRRGVFLLLGALALLGLAGAGLAWLAPWGGTTDAARPAGPGPAATLPQAAAPGPLLTPGVGASSSAASPTPILLPLPPPVAAPREPPLLSHAALLEHHASRPTLVRLAANPRVFVIDFPDLDSQAAALNRVAALIEKDGLPRDRVLSEAEMARTIAATGQSAGEFYFGHDYRGGDLARFFTLAQRGNEPLRPEEQWLAEQYAEMRRLVPDGEVALITVTQVGPRVDAATREAILRHETAHGFYFTDPSFAGYVRRSWTERFSAADRDALRGFLRKEGYDTTLDDLMANEAMAYLLFTSDPRFFTPAMIGLDAAQVERLRALLRPGVPESLRPLMLLPPR